MLQTRRKYFESVGNLSEKWIDSKIKTADHQTILAMQNLGFRICLSSSLQWQMGLSDSIGQLEAKVSDRRTTRLGYWYIWAWSIGNWDFYVPITWSIRVTFSINPEWTDGYLTLRSRLSIANIYFQTVTTIRLGKLGMQHNWECTGIGNALELGMQQRVELGKQCIED